MKKYIIVAVVVVALGAAVGLFLKYGNNDNGSEDLKFGFIGPLTGDAAVYGEPINRAIQLAVSEINQAGGIRGKQVKLLVEDGKCDPQAAANAAQKLTNIDNVRFIIGPACSGELLAAAPITEPAEVIMISASASSPSVTDAGEFIFRTYPSDALAGKVAATYAYRELGSRKVAVFSELTDYAQNLRNVFKSTFEDLGGEVVADETYTSGETDFRTQIAKIKASGPDVIYVVPQSPTPGIAFFKQVREAGIETNMMTSEILLVEDIIRKNPGILEGVIGVGFGVDFDRNEKTRAFRDAHMTMFGVEPGQFAANAYDAVYLLKDAIEEVGFKTTDVRDWLYTVHDWPGVVGNITIDENGDPILGVNVWQLSSGEMHDLGLYTP